MIRIVGFDSPVTGPATPATGESFGRANGRGENALALARRTFTDSPRGDVE
jgi:hypothetical protein